MCCTLGVFEDLNWEKRLWLSGLVEEVRGSPRTAIVTSERQQISSEQQISTLSSDQNSSGSAGNVLLMVDQSSTPSKENEGVEKREAKKDETKAETEVKEEIEVKEEKEKEEKREEKRDVEIEMSAV